MREREARLALPPAHATDELTTGAISFVAAHCALTDYRRAVGSGGGQCSPRAPGATMQSYATKSAVVILAEEVGYFTIVGWEDDVALVMHDRDDPEFDRIPVARVLRILADAMDPEAGEE